MVIVGGSGMWSLMYGCCCSSCMVMVCRTKGLETQTRLEPFLLSLGDMVVVVVPGGGRHRSGMWYLVEVTVVSGGSTLIRR
jgi:hypothetical protein